MDGLFLLRNWCCGFRSVAGQIRVAGIFVQKEIEEEMRIEVFAKLAVSCGHIPLAGINAADGYFPEAAAAFDEHESLSSVPAHKDDIVVLFHCDHLFDGDGDLPDLLVLRPLTRLFSGLSSPAGNWPASRVRSVRVPGHGHRASCSPATSRLPTAGPLLDS